MFFYICIFFFIFTFVLLSHFTQPEEVRQFGEYGPDLVVFEPFFYQ